MLMTLLRRFYLIFFSGSLKAMPAVGCCCHVCGDLSLQRQRIKRLLLSLEREHSGVKSSMLRALANVAPRHCIRHTSSSCERATRTVADTAEVS